MLVLLALNVAAELVSFSRVIDAVPPLRWFDRLGRCAAARRSRRRRRHALGPTVAPQRRDRRRRVVERDAGAELRPGA